MTTLKSTVTGPGNLMGGLLEQLKQVKDPRIDRTKRHLLSDILAIAICAVICGADEWTEIEAFGKAKQAWFKSFLGLPNGIPSHDTLARVLARLDPLALQQCFVAWIQGLGQQLADSVVAIDGKTVRHSFDRAAGKAAIHRVSAWASGHHLVLGQVKVDDNSNEIVAIPQLLAMLELGGTLVTIDAMGWQKEIAARLHDQGADYVLALKGNQGNLHQPGRGAVLPGRPEDPLPPAAPPVPFQRQERSWPHRHPPSLGGGRYRMAGREVPLAGTEKPRQRSGRTLDRRPHCAREPLLHQQPAGRCPAAGPGHPLALGD